MLALFITLTRLERDTVGALFALTAAFYALCKRAPILFYHFIRAGVTKVLHI